MIHQHQTVDAWASAAAYGAAFWACAAAYARTKKQCTADSEIFVWFLAELVGHHGWALVLSEDVLC